MNELPGEAVYYDRERPRLFDGPVFRLLVFPMAFVWTILWISVAFRLLSLPILLAVIVMYFLGSRRCRTKWVLACWLLLVGSTLLPIDVSLRNYPGPPRFVPLVMGLLGPGAEEREARGEFMSGGCVVYGHEPQWVWVW